MRTLLIVDDNAEFASLLAAAAEGSGLSVRVAHNGGEALEIIDLDKLDAALVDLLLPDIGGEDLLRTLRSRNIATFAMSGVFRGEHFARAAIDVCGARAFFEKPLKQQEVMDRICKVLEELPSIPPASGAEPSPPEPLPGLPVEQPAALVSEPPVLHPPGSAPPEPESFPAADSAAAAGEPAKVEGLEASPPPPASFPEAPEPVPTAPSEPSSAAETPAEGSAGEGTPPSLEAPASFPPLSSWSPPEGAADSAGTPLELGFEPAPLNVDDLGLSEPSDAENELDSAQETGEAPAAPAAAEESEPPSIPISLDDGDELPLGAPEPAPATEAEVPPPPLVTAPASRAPAEPPRADLSPNLPEPTTWSATPPAPRELPDLGPLTLRPGVFAHFLAALGRQRATGELRFEQESLVKVVGLSDGKVFFAASNLGSERLLRYVARAGSLSPAQLCDLQEKVSRGSRTGDALIELGFVSQEQRLELVGQLVCSIVWSLLDASGGEASFIPRAAARRDLLPLALDPVRLIIEGYRRSFTLVRLRELADASKRYVAVREPPWTPEEMGLSPGEAALLAAADGSKALEDLFLLSELPEREALAALVGLTHLRVLEPRAPTSRRVVLF